MLKNKQSWEILGLLIFIVFKEGWLLRSNQPFSI